MQELTAKCELKENSASESQRQLTESKFLSEKEIALLQQKVEFIATTCSEKDSTQQVQTD